MQSRAKLPGILSRWKIDDVEVERELAFVKLGFAQPSFSPVPCEIGRGRECRDIYLSGKIESVDHIGNAVRAENRRARHDVKVEMPGFKTGESRNIRVETAAQVRQDFQLQVGAVTETVEVAASAALLHLFEHRAGISL